MAIPGIPQNLEVQSANQQVLISWDLVAGASSYIIQRSLDNVSYGALVTVSGSPLATSYLDTAVSLNTQYWYKVASATLPATPAQGLLTFSGQPTAGEQFSVGNVIFIAGTDYAIGGTVADTISNIVVAVTSTVALKNIVIATRTATVLTFTSYLAGDEGNGLQLSSNIAAATVSPFSGGSPGIQSSFTLAASAIPTPTGEMSLSQIRDRAKQRADRVNSQFVTDTEWNSYINQSMFELYDLLVTLYEDYFLASPIQFNTDGTTYLFPLPNGSNSFQDANNPSVTLVPRPFYKLLGVDLALNNATNAYVTINKFNFIDRNRFVYPNTASTIYGVFNMQYRVMGSNIEFIPTPTAGQHIRLWYIPRLVELLQDTDTSDIGISGWIEYVIVKAAYYALTKEESDTAPLVMQLQALNDRINSTAANRDAGQPDKISDTRSNNSNGWGNGFGGGFGPIGGF